MCNQAVLDGMRLFFSIIATASLRGHNRCHPGNVVLVSSVITISLETGKVLASGGRVA